MSRLAKYIRPYWGYIFLTLFIKFLSTYMELMIPDLMEVVLDEKVPAADMHQIFLYGGAMLLCAVLALGGHIWSNRMTAVSSGRITRAIRHDLFVKLENLSARQIDQLTVPAAESRLTSDTYNVNQMLTRIQRIGVRAPCRLVGGIIMMLRMDAVMALVLVALLPIIAVVVYYVTKHSVPMYTKQQTVLDQVVRVVQENITGIRVIKALSKTDYEKQRFHKVNGELADLGMKAGMITSVTNPASTLVLNLGLALVVLVGAYRVNSGVILSGVIVAFLTYFTMILNAMIGVTRIFILWSKGEASAKRIADVLEEPEDLQILPSEEKQEQKPAHIEFRNVSFSYTGVGVNLHGISFRLEYGKTLGILGPTGSGKSTLVNLLTRQYDPDSGTVLIGGEDIRKIEYDRLRKKFGIVFQNDFIAEGTIGENVRFFREIGEDALERAVRTAQAEFVWEKEGGMDAEVAVRGNNLSGGQKQRLLIARALAAEPEILILDDASSALDYQTDAQLRRALRENYRNTTTVVVAQRVSSLRHADLILVLEDGKVIGEGNHQQLMENCEEYRVIAHTQMEREKEGA